MSPISRKPRPNRAGSRDLAKLRANVVAAQARGRDARADRGASPRRRRHRPRRDREDAPHRRSRRRLLYQLSARTPALGHHEQVTADIVWIAIRELQEVTAATMMVAGAVWLAEQFGIGRELLVSFITEISRAAVQVHARAPRLGRARPLRSRRPRQPRVARRHHRKAKLPMFAPLELSRGKP
jgi:hypothetical protein